MNVEREEKTLIQSHIATLDDQATLKKQELRPTASDPTLSIANSL